MTEEKKKLNRKKLFDVIYVLYSLLNIFIMYYFYQNMIYRVYSLKPYFLGFLMGMGMMNIIINKIENN